MTLRRVAEAAQRRHPTPWRIEGEVVEWKYEQESAFDDTGASLVSSKTNPPNKHYTDYIVEGGQQDEQGGAIGILTKEAADYFGCFGPDVILKLLNDLERAKATITQMCANSAAGALADQLVKCQLDLDAARKALALTNSMIASGESHTETSVNMVMKGMGLWPATE